MIRSCTVDTSDRCSCSLLPAVGLSPKLLSSDDCHIQLLSAVELRGVAEIQ